jgi:hypothetical protein
MASQSDSAMMRPTTMQSRRSRFHSTRARKDWAWTLRSCQLRSYIFRQRSGVQTYAIEEYRKECADKETARALADQRQRGRVTHGSKSSSTGMGYITSSKGPATGHEPRCRPAATLTHRSAWAPCRRVARAKTEGRREGQGGAMSHIDGKEHARVGIKGRSDDRRDLRRSSV